MRNNWEMYLLLLLPLAYFIIFCYWPMYGVTLAFKSYNIMKGIAGSPWVGLKHFKLFFSSIFFVRVLKNTVGISLYSLVAGFPIPIILALMMNEVKNRSFKKFVQNISYAPYFISQVVMVGIIIMFLSPVDGIINIAIKALGQKPVKFMTEPGWFKHIYVWSGIWQGAGWGTVIYMAVLTGVDPQLIEAAVMDGASRMRRIWHINLPHVIPTAVIMLILSAGGIMNVGFEKVFLMQNMMNMESSDVIATYVYRLGLMQVKYDVATAVGLFNSVINAIMLIIVNTVSKRIGSATLW
jgi:putative aldouronate transport system permease protein